MQYNPKAESGGIDVEFEHAHEVATVRAAFEEHALHLLALGNDSSISDYQRELIRTWQTAPRNYRAGRPSQLTERLGYFVEATEERVDALLGETDNPDRLVDAGRRYELGAHAAHLLESIELQAGMDAALAEMLGDEEPPRSMH